MKLKVPKFEKDPDATPEFDIRDGGFTYPKRWTSKAEAAANGTPFEKGMTEAQKMREIERMRSEDYEQSERDAMSFGSYTDDGEEKVAHAYGDEPADVVDIQTDRPTMRPLDQNLYKDVKDVGDVEIGDVPLAPLSPKQQIKAFIKEKPDALIAKSVRDQFVSRQQALTQDTNIKINRRDLDLPNRTIIKQAEDAFFEDKDANPIVIFDRLNQMWGEGEWLDWEPETILETANQEGFKIAPENMDKIFAVRAVLKTDEFHSNPRIFEKVCLAFNGRVVDWGMVQRPRIHEMAMTVALVSKYLRDEMFAPEIEMFIAGTALEDGFVLLPAVLGFAESAFSVELAIRMGAEALEIQEGLMKALEEEDPELAPQEYLVQYLRVIKCQMHVDASIRSVGR